MPRRSGSQEEELWAVVIKRGDKVRCYRTVDGIPQIEPGNYTVKDEEGTVTITAWSGEKAEIETVNFKGTSWVMDKNAEGKVVLTPAPQTFGFSIEKDENGNVKTRPLTNSVRAYVSAYMEDGIYGLIKGENLTIRKLM